MILFKEHAKSISLFSHQCQKYRHLPYDSDKLDVCSLISTTSRRQKAIISRLQNQYQLTQKMNFTTRVQFVSTVSRNTISNSHSLMRMVIKPTLSNTDNRTRTAKTQTRLHICAALDCVFAVQFFSRQVGTTVTTVT